jgi:transposase-like protein
MGTLDAIDDKDEAACYAVLLGIVRPDELVCPRCQAREGLHVHRRRRAPVLDYQCASCGRVFNAWTGTALEGTHYRPTVLIKLIRAILERRSTAELARELRCQRSRLQCCRWRLTTVVREWARRQPSAPPRAPPHPAP